METNLSCIRPGTQAVVTQIGTDARLKCRLRDFGLVPGTMVRCRYRAPGGSVTALEFRGTVVALRTRDLQKIRVRC